MSMETKSALEITHYRARSFPVSQGKYLDTRIGEWVVTPFGLIHDTSCLGFVISIDKERLVYITDSMYNPYKLPPGTTHLMVSANYDLDILNENIDSGYVAGAAKSRLLHSHSSLETVKDMLKANDLSSLREIILIHGSDRNLDKEQAKREIQEICGVPVYIH